MQKRFVSESELEEIKKKREEEWKKAREEGREIADPLEPVDTRSLYERLQEQKEAKKEAVDEQLKFKNMIYKGLDDDESAFLSFVADKQAEIDNRRFCEDSKELQGFRDAVSNLTSDKKPEEDRSDGQQKEKKTFSNTLKTMAKSQQSLMSGLIRRKRVTTDNSSENRISKKSKGEVVDEDAMIKNKSSRSKSPEEKEPSQDLETDKASSATFSSSLANLGSYSSSDSE